VKTELPVYDIENFIEYRNKGILASRFRQYSDSHKHLHTAHKHSFYHLVYFIQGTGNHQIDFKQYPVSAGQIYFMIPGQAHSWNFDEEPDGYIVNFSKEYFSTFLYNSIYPENFHIFSGNTDQQVISVPEEDVAWLTNHFEQILKEGQVRQHFGDDLVRTLLLQVFIWTERISNYGSQSSADSYNHILFRNFQRLVGKNYKEMKLPKDYANLLYITPNHLNSLCKDIIGISAGEMIRAQVVLEAKRLLINLDMSIGEIASTLNFKDNSYFIKFFKKQELMTPEKFRKSNLQHNGN
jgi:AraC family transcriptional activator of pobA